MSKTACCEYCGTASWGSDHAEDCPNNPFPGFGTGLLDDPEIASRVIVNRVTDGFRHDVARILNSDTKAPK
jgi:hypothetical protein